MYDANDGLDLPVELSPASRRAAFFTVFVGILAVGAGLQAGLFLMFRRAWMGFVPWIELGTGVALVWLAIQLAHPRIWAQRASFRVLAGLAIGSTVWGGWLLFGGFLAPLQLMVAPAAAVVAVMVHAARADVERVGQIRAAAEAEFAALTARPPMGMGARIVLAVVGLFVVFPAMVWMLAPRTFDTAGLHARALAAGRLPFGSSFVAHATRFPYADSPLRWYLETEARYTEVPTEDVLGFADRLAERVALHLIAETGETDPVAAERALWAAGKGTLLPTWIAAELRAAEVFYTPESLFSRSFDPDLHVMPEQIHMDCDQLVWMFLHVAWRLDLAMSAMPAVQHVYLRYAPPDGGAPLYVETTEMRAISVSEDAVDYMGDTLGAGFFIEEDHHSTGRGGLMASPELAEAAGLYTPATERDIRDMALGNVLVGVQASGRAVDTVAEAEAALPGTRSMILVANLYQEHIQRALAAEEHGDVAGARRSAERARAIRAEFGVLVVRGRAVEEEILRRLEVVP